MAFHDHTENGITVLQSDLLCGSIRHGFSTRTGGVSPSPWNSLNLGVGRGDDPANVQENFRRLCGVLGLCRVLRGVFGQRDGRLKGDGRLPLVGGGSAHAHQCADGVKEPAHARGVGGVNSPVNHLLAGKGGGS